MGYSTNTFGILPIGSNNFIILQIGNWLFCHGSHVLNTIKKYTPHNTPVNTSESESDSPNNKVSYCIIRDFNKINIQFDKEVEKEEDGGITAELKPIRTFMSIKKLRKN